MNHLKNHFRTAKYVQTRVKQYSYAIAILSSLVLAVAPQPSSALPGQSFSAVRRSVEANSLWRGQTLKRQEYAHRISTPLQDGTLVLEVIDSPMTKQSSLETLEVQDPSTAVEFSRDGGDGLSLIRQVWGEAVARDFANARFTDDLRDVRFETPAKFFRGNRYGYQTGIMIANMGGSQRSVRYTFTVIALTDWDRRVNFYRACNKNPDNWECKATL